MKRLAFLTLLLLVSLALVCCNERNTAPDHHRNSVSEIEKKSGGKIEFLKEIHNFGSLKAGEVVAFSFVFSNTGADPVKITKIENSCGCINVQYNAETVGPGEQSTVEVIFNTAGEWGNQIKTLRINTTAGQIKELTVTAYIENENFNNLINN